MKRGKAVYVPKQPQPSTTAQKTEEEPQTATTQYIQGFGTLSKVVSGGQTGADRAGLEAAQILGIETGGWAPQGFLTGAGKDLTLGTKFGLKELVLNGKPSVAAMYVSRSKKNVEDSDATLAVRLQTSGGTDKTINYCLNKNWAPLPENPEEIIQNKFPHKYKPCLVISSVSAEAKNENITKIREFIQKYNVKVLNIAGHREDTAGVPNFSTVVTNLLAEAFAPVSD